MEGSTLPAVAACVTYVTMGPWLILLNNRLLNELDFPHPIALSAFGVVFSALVSRALFVCRRHPSRRAPSPPGPARERWRVRARARARASSRSPSPSSRTRLASSTAPRSRSPPSPPSRERPEPAPPTRSPPAPPSRALRVGARVRAAT